MKQIIKKLFDRIFNRETITYAVIGVFTTVVNFTSFHLLSNIFEIPNLISNIIAWILAVTSAYITNKTVVFLSKSHNTREEAIKVTKFFGARLISLGVEELGILLFVELYNFPNMIVKAGLAVIVIILNYIFSKLYIFNN